MRSEVGGFLRTELSSNAGAKELRTNPPLNQVGTALQAQYSPTALLYMTVVRDGALPSGFQQEFETLASAIETGADRSLRKSAKRTDTDAVMYLNSLEQKRKETERADKTAADQFIQAASLKPRRFLAQYMSTQFDGPSARRDAQEAETKQVDFYALRNHQRYSHTDGKDVNRQTWAAACGWRQASLNPQVPCEGSPKVFDLVRTQQGTELSHVVRPTVRVPSRETLRTVQQGSFEGEEMVGTPAQERLTRSALYGVIYRELLASAQPGRPSKQAPRMLSPKLFFLEQLVMNETSPMYLRVYSWWMLVQNWATLRFSDHRGLNPGEVTFREGSFHARLTRSKTIGQDKTITSKPLVTDACCFLSHREWLTRGWSLLQGMANFPRDYLMPAPASHCQSC